MSQYGNKIHIYSLIDFSLQYCIYLGQSELKLINVSFSIKSRFTALLIINNNSLRINIFDLKNLNENDHLCQCDDHNDEEVVRLDGNQLTRQGSVFGSFFSKLSKVRTCLILLKYLIFLVNIS